MECLCNFLTFAHKKVINALHGNAKKKDKICRERLRVVKKLVGSMRLRLLQRWMIVYAKLVSNCSEKRFALSCPYQIQEKLPLPELIFRT